MVVLRNLACRCLGMLFVLTPAVLFGDDSPLPSPSWRLYSKGRITNEDYQMPAPPRRQGSPDDPLDAKMFTGLYFYTDFNFFVQRQQVTLQLKSIRFVGYVDRKRSWRRRELDAALLDHEQGHFDINEIYVRRAAALIRDQIRRPGGVQASARTRKQAEKVLNDKIGELIEPVVYDLRKAHASYDRQTFHGTIKDQQELARKDQLSKLRSPATAPQPRGNAPAEPGTAEPASGSRR